MTGYEDEKIKKQAMFLRPLAFIVKPFDVDKIIQIIRENIEK